MVNKDGDVQAEVNVGIDDVKRAASKCPAAVRPTAVVVAVACWSNGCRW